MHANAREAGNGRKATVTLLLGGARSGKSTLAEALATERFRRPLYLATSEVVDAEMAERIRRHRERRGAEWRCVEEPIDLAAALRERRGDSDGIVLECLTTWLSTVLVKEGREAVERRQQELLQVLAAPPAPLIIVSNEVGMGVVPAHELGRTFRDLAGWLNQAVAAAADEVALVVAGLPMWLKGRRLSRSLS